MDQHDMEDLCLPWELLPSSQGEIGPDEGYRGEAWIFPDGSPVPLSKLECNTSQVRVDAQLIVKDFNSC